MVLPLHILCVSSGFELVTFGIAPIPSCVGGATISAAHIANSHLCFAAASGVPNDSCLLCWKRQQTFSPGCHLGFLQPSITSPCTLLSQLEDL